MEKRKWLLTCFTLGLLQLQFSAVGAEQELPRTASGRVDFHGYWSNASLTKMEREPPYRDIGLVIPQERVAELTAGHYHVVRQLTDDNQVAGQLPDGSDLALGRGYNSFWVDPGLQFSVIDGQARTSWITWPENGLIPFSEEGRKLRRENRAFFSGVLADEVSMGTAGPESRALEERCIIGMGSTGGPPMTNVRYNNMYQFIQTEDYFVILVEMVHDARIIPLNGGGRPQAWQPWFGDSVGYWDGDTLVVETANIHPQQGMRGYIAALSDRGRVVERFSRLSQQQVLYEFEISDPVYYAEPWRGQMVFTASDEPIYEYACHEGNYGLSGILAGARRLESRQ